MNFFPFSKGGSILTQSFTFSLSHFFFCLPFPNSSTPSFLSSLLPLRFFYPLTSSPYCKFKGEGKDNVERYKKTREWKGKGLRQKQRRQKEKYPLLAAPQIDGHRVRKRCRREVYGSYKREVSRETTRLLILSCSFNFAYSYAPSACLCSH